MNPAVVIAPVRGLLWREWRAHRTLVFNFLTAWLVCLWILPVFFSPAWILGFGALYALMAGPAFGGAEAQEGTEEFAFALPPTRSERYVARLLLGGATALGFVGLGILAVAADLPQKLWGLFFESGLTQPFPAVGNALLWPMAVAVPLALYGGGFALAALVPPKTVSSCWFFAAAGVGLVAALAFAGEHVLWQRLTGWIAVPTLAVLSVAAPLGGGRLYRRKEGVSDPDARGGSPAWIAWVIVAVVIVILFLLMTFSVSGA